MTAELRAGIQIQILILSSDIIHDVNLNVACNTCLIVIKCTRLTTVWIEALCKHPLLDTGMLLSTQRHCHESPLDQVQLAILPTDQTWCCLCRTCVLDLHTQTIICCRDLST